MLSLYFSLLLVLFFWACRCCPTVPSDCSDATGCDLASMPDFEFAIAGVGSGTCTTVACEATFNKTHTITHPCVSSICNSSSCSSADCTWGFIQTGNWCGVIGCSAWVLKYTGSLWELEHSYSQTPPASIVKYTSTSLDCSGSTVFDLDTEGTGCSGFPSTVTLTAV